MTSYNLLPIRTITTRQLVRRPLQNSSLLWTIDLRLRSILYSSDEVLLGSSITSL
jgi:hypothetical protein